MVLNRNIYKNGVWETKNSDFLHFVSKQKILFVVLKYLILRAIHRVCSFDLTRSGAGKYAPTEESESLLASLFVLNDRRNWCPELI